MKPFDGEAEINPGQYKKEPNYLISYTGERIDFAPPQEVPRLMNELVNWLNNHIDPPKRGKRKYDLPPLLVAAGFHVQFIQIHPFGDGNGRIARILMNLILMLCGYVPAIVRLEDRNDYYAALDLSTMDNLDPFAEFLGEQCIRSLELAIRAAKGEDIEELGDLDKKLALLKRKMGENPDERIEIRKNRDSVLKVIDESIKPLVELFEEKMVQFEPLFFERESGFFVCTNPKGYILRYKKASPIEILMAYQKSIINTATVSLVLPDKIMITSSFFNLRRNNDSKKYTIAPIECVFHSSVYEIKIAGEKISINKLYHQNLPQEEMENIVKHIFNELLSSIEKEVGPLS